MSWFRGTCLTLVAAGAAVGVFGARAPSSREEIDAFNNRYVELHLKMDTAGIYATWADDGVSLMPGEAPLIGKKAIVAWVENILSQMKGYKVVKEEIDFRRQPQISPFRRIGHRNGLRNIRSCNRRMASRSSIRGERWRWCCTERRTESGRSNRRCGTKRRSSERIKKLPTELEECAVLFFSR